MKMDFARLISRFAAPALLPFVLAACGDGGDAADPDPFVLGFIPSQRASELVPDAQALAEFLSARMGREVEVEIPTTYEPLIEGLRFGHVHAAFMDGGPAWIAHERIGAEAVLAELRSNGETFYYAEAFTRVGSEIDSLSDVLGKRLAFTSRTGSSGFLMPIGTMIAGGMIPVEGDQLSDLEEALESNFEATVTAGGYQQALDALLQGRVDVAFGADDAPERFLSDEQQTQVRSFHRFGRIPSHTVMVAPSLSETAVARFRDAMLELNEPENVGLLQAVYGVDGVEPVDTEEHLGEFGRAVLALPGMERTMVGGSGS